MRLPPPLLRGLWVMGGLLVLLGSTPRTAAADNKNGGHDSSAAPHFDEAGYIRTVSVHEGGADCGQEDVPGNSMNDTMAYIRQGEHVWFTYLGAAFHYDPSTNTVIHARRGTWVILAVIGGQVIFSDLGPCKFVATVEAGSVLGVKGAGKVDEAGVLKDGTLDLPFIRSGSAVAWGDMSGTYDASTQTVSLTSSSSLVRVPHTIQPTVKGKLVKDGKVSLTVVEGSVLGVKPSVKTEGDAGHLRWRRR